MTCILNKSVGLQQSAAASPSSIACTVFDIQFTEVKCLQPWKVTAHYGKYTKQAKDCRFICLTIYRPFVHCTSAYSSAVTHRRDTIPGVWTWVGLSSVSCPHNLMLQRCVNTSDNTCHPNINCLSYTHMDTKDEIQPYMLKLAYHDSQYDVQVAGLLLTQLHNHFVDLA